MEHEFECAKLKLGAQIQLLRDEIERQFKRILAQTVEAHENDRKNNFERYTSLVSLEYSPEVFDRLKGWVRAQFPCYISGFQFSQGGSFSINFTNNPSPGVWEPIVVDMNKIIDPATNVGTDGQGNTAASTGRQPPDSRSTTPSSTHLPIDHRSPRGRKPARRKRTADPPRSGVKKSGQRPAKNPRRIKHPAKKGSEHPDRVIKTSVATRKISENPSWAFSYDLGDGLCYYILRCPTQGCQFSFSMHPFKNNLAIAHFEECKVPYSDEADIVRRYARQLQPQRTVKTSTQVTKRWVDKYNRQVSHARLSHRGEEGRLASETTEVTDESLTELSEMPPRGSEVMQG
ncbi:hypothetical protein LX32DRAFT_635269 [Colletotrichum zoysiae]|uniref:Uncharacterized protein n=1 Tax=Colletotrichum zoysiae TaxID=1216348 RepID=A0AAD9M6F3_9PEZI|nr:hypothetical protein LX32DRAFT_635269 [Colletotrichum zoysiae]